MIVVLSGCGGNLPTVSAGGRVTFHGQPVDAANIALIRDDDTDAGPSSTATTDSDGRFELRTGNQWGAVPGSYRVVVQKSNLAKLNIPDPLPEGMTRAEYLRANNLIPQSELPLQYARYDSTPLRVKISEDSDKNDFDLMLEGAVPPPPVRDRRAGRVDP